jgi:hypothetical protein
MSQYDFGNLESPLSGTTFFNTHLEPWRDALHSMHKGDSRPSYAVAGMMWVDDTTEPWILKMFNGTANDVTLGTIDPTNFWFKPSGTSIWGGSAGGTANALTLTPTIPLTTYAAGVVYECLITAINTSSSVTVNISALGTKNVKASIGVGKVNVPVGALQNGMIARFVYDGTDLILLNVRANNKGEDVATASTVNLDTATGDYVSLTGTTTVTAITLSEGQERTCHCAAAFTLTNGASLILPTGANIITAAGDVFVVRGESSSVVRVVSYMRANGTPLAGGGLTEGTEQSASGSDVDFTSIPAGTKRIIVQFVGVSLSGSDAILVQLGDSGGVETSGYSGAGSQLAGTVGTSQYTAGFGIRTTANTMAVHGSLILSREDSANNTWVASGVLANSDAGTTFITAGSKSLSATLDRVRITRDGSNTFSAGSLNITYE